MSRRLTTLLVLLVAVIATAGACASNARSGGESASVAVEIKTFQYSPNELTVEKGTTVTWTNNDEILHTVTSKDTDSEAGGFDGQLADKGTTFSHTFDQTGTFAYGCTRHSGMKATVVVS